MLRMAQSGLSFEAVDTKQADSRVGVYLCTRYDHGVSHPIETEVSEMTLEQDMEFIFDILDQLHPVVNEEIFERRGHSSYLEGTHLSVLREYSGQGIAGKLIAAVEKKATELGLDLVYICCSSEFTAKAVFKRQYKMFHSLHYADYQKDGRVIFQPSGPHQALKCCLKELS